MKFERNFFQMVCIASSILGLLLVYVAALNAKPREVSLTELDESLVGRSVTVRRFIDRLKFHPDGQIFLTIGYNKTNVQVPLFSSFLSSAKLDVSKIKVGKTIVVSGTVDLYRNQLQIIPRKAEDVKILGD
jgi:DNA/RNA endonuclease YhcR with UshA esterase domain